MGWCASCYIAREKDNFPIGKLATDETNEDDLVGDEVEDSRDVNNFRYARKGDNFMCPFQCDLCHFRNLTGRNPGENFDCDLRLLVAIRRAILDSFWARAESTVGNNLRDLKKFKTIGRDRLGLNTILPEMGPFPLEDVWGMGVAVVILERSMDKGIYKETLQFQTARKLRSVFSNAWGASINSMTRGVMAKDTVKTFVTKCPTYCLWFERFVKGMHSRMGDDTRPDVAISIEVMKALMNRVNIDYMEANEKHQEKFFARAGLMFMSAFLGSLRGEEVPKLLRKHFLGLNKESMLLTKDPHVVLPLFGKFKGEQGIPRCFIRRVVLKTKSGLNMQLWVERIMLIEKNSLTKFLFANEKGTRETGGIYEGYFHQKLESIQNEEFGLIPKKVKVDEMYGIGRSFRRGSTTAATNAPNEECNDTDIKRNNRWRTQERAGTKTASLDMIQHYTDTLQSVNADLKFSKCL
jgi:hypothetical protein